MNRASDVAVLNWITTASIADLEVVVKAISGRLVALREHEEQIAAQTGTVPTDASPLVLHDFGFAGMARWLELQGMRMQPSTAVQEAAEQSNVSAHSGAKASLAGLDIDSSTSRVGLRTAR